MNVLVNNYEERMSRIKARSQQILVSRKKMQIRVVFACVPVLITVVALLFMLPKDNRKSMSNSASLHQVPQTSIEDVVPEKVVLLFESDKCNLTVTDPMTIAAAKEMLASWFVGDQLATSSPSGALAEDDSESTERKKTLSIQFYNGDKIENKYVLIGNELKCLQTGKTVRLSEAQIEEIRRYIP